MPVWDCVYLHLPTIKQNKIWTTHGWPMLVTGVHWLKPGARPGPMPGARFQTPHFTLSEVGMKDSSSWTLQLESLSNLMK